MNIQEIAQQLVNELNGELSKKTEEHQLLQGAIQGVNLLYTRLQEAEQKVTDEHEQDNKTKARKSKSKAKK